MSHRPGVLSRIRKRIRQGKGGKQTLEYLMILLKDPCPYCGLYGSDTIDHITPVVKIEQLNTGNGRNHWTNFVACHMLCNVRKGEKGVLSGFKLRLIKPEEE